MPDLFSTSTVGWSEDHHQACAVNRFTDTGFFNWRFTLLSTIFCDSTYMCRCAGVIEGKTSCSWMPWSYTGRVLVCPAKHSSVSILFMVLPRNWALCRALETWITNVRPKDILRLKGVVWWHSFSVLKSTIVRYFVRSTANLLSVVCQKGNDMF